MNDVTEKTRQLAEAHAKFLCDEVFTPAFVMGFVHGAKHAREECEKASTNNSRRKD